MTGQRTQEPLLRRVRKAWVSYLFLLPYASVFLAFTVLPVIMSLWNSFTYNNLLEPARFVGFSNYVRMFTQDASFLQAVKNTFVIALVTGPGGYLLSLFLAWLINGMTRPLRTLFVLIFYAPTMSSAIYSIWGILFSSDEYGYINGFLMSLNLIREPVSWLLDEQYILTVVIICVLWTSMGAGFLSFVAGLRSIDKQYYEAASVDGIRSRWQELWFITLPMMKPQLLFGAIMSITSSFSVHEVTMVLAGFPSTNNAALTVVNHLYDYGYLRFELGYASAIATVLFLTMMGANKLVNLLLRRVGK
ncbi:MAG TPA: sugar ABC transporter permease [Firmicutes bacterium]|nr:sugar ABC transporter permease [Bacillota bacterium]